MTRGSRFLASACMLAALLAAPLSARGYEIQKTSTGKELHWFSLPVPFFIDSHGYSGISDGTLLDAEKASFQAWEDVPACDARYDVGTSSHGVSDIFIDSNKPGRDRINEMAFVESGWARSGGDSTLIALTFTYFADGTGKILENDIVANAQDFQWTDGDVTVKTDVRNFLTHEVGHSYGLGHSADPNATMFATGTQNEVKKRDLAPDDIAAITHLYPPGCCDHTRTGDMLSKIGCDVDPRGAPSPRASGLALFAVAAVVIVRRGGLRRAAPVISAGVLALALSISGDARATVALDVSLEELAARSEAVVRGTVVWSEALRNPGGSIVTLTQIEVAQVLSGEAPQVVTVVQPGGTPKDSDEGMLVEGTARFEVDEEVVLFAATAESGFHESFPDAFHPVGLAQGVFRVVRAPGVPPRLLRDLGGMARVSRDGERGFLPVEGDSLSGIRLDELERRVTRAR